MSDFEVRVATEADRPAVLSLLGVALGWREDARFPQLFGWKHEQNPFGPSPGLVALDGDRLIGFRTFLRWEFRDARGARWRAVRAVDTATDPEYQGRGVFRALTTRAVDELARAGVDFVFNTPNHQSRPGYLRMGWQVVGRLPAAVRFRSPAAVLRALRAQAPAERWSVPVEVGRPARDVLADPRIDELISALGSTRGLHTNRSADYLRWRYGFPPLAYRAVTVSTDATDGLAIFRVRRRGAATECALCEVLVPGAEARATRSLLRGVARAAGADYVLRVGGAPVDRCGYVRLPGQGPILTWRPLAPTAPGASLTDWNLTLGDVELF